MGDSARDRIMKAAQRCAEHGKPANIGPNTAVEDENGVVTIYDINGAPVGVMSRENFDALGLFFAGDGRGC